MDETTQKSVDGAEAAHLLRYFSFQCSMGRASDEKSSHRLNPPFGAFCIFFCFLLSV
jgi:hypothetical protein